MFVFLGVVLNGVIFGWFCIIWGLWVVLVGRLLEDLVDFAEGSVGGTKSSPPFKGLLKLCLKGFKRSIGRFYIFLNVSAF